MPKPYRIDQNSEFKEENGGFSDGTLKQVANHKAVSSLRIAKAIFIGDAAVGKTSLGLFLFQSWRPSGSGYSRTTWSTAVLGRGLSRSAFSNP